MTFNGREASIEPSSLPSTTIAWSERKFLWAKILFRSPWVFPWIGGGFWLLSFVLYRDVLLLNWLVLGAAYLVSGGCLTIKQERGSFLFFGALLLGAIWGSLQGGMTWHWALIEWVNLLIMHLGLQECKRDCIVRQIEIDRICAAQREAQKVWEEKSEIQSSSMEALCQERDRYREQLEQQQQYVLYVQREIRDMIDQKEALAITWTQISSQLTQTQQPSVQTPIQLVEDREPVEMARWKGLYHQLRDQFTEKAATLDQARKRVFELEGELEVRKLQMEETLQQQEQLYARCLDEWNQDIAMGGALEDQLIDAEEWIAVLLQENVESHSELPGGEDLASRGSNE